MELVNVVILMVMFAGNSPEVVYKQTFYSTAACEAVKNGLFANKPAICVVDKELVVIPQVYNTTNVVK